MEPCQPEAMSGTIPVDLPPSPPARQTTKDLTMWKRIFAASRFDKRFSDRRKQVARRRLRIEAVERRRLMATDLASITGLAVIDVEGDGISATDPPVLVDNANNLVEPGTAGATGVTIQLFRDDGANPGVFESDDTLVGTTVSDTTTGRYRFDRLTVDQYFVVQDNVDGLDDPAAQLVDITEADGERTVAIDEFADQVERNIVVTPASATSIDFQNPVSGTLGGQRDVQLTLDNNSGQFTFFLNANGGQVGINSGSGATGTAIIQYDGPDNAITIDPDGLGGVSLEGVTADDPNPSGGVLVFNVDAQLAGDTVDIEVFSGAGNSSTATFDIPIGSTIATDPQVEVLVPLDSFTTVAGTGADFANVGAIEVSVNLVTPDNDIDLELIEARRADVFVANLENILPLTLSGTVFIDVSDTGTNDGVQAANEANFTDPVTVQLFVDDGSPFDEGTATPIATTTTNTVGDYFFDDLDPGEYRVAIPASQFVDNRANASANGVLFGFTSSLLGANAPDPDDDIDLDDNGELLASGAIVSDPITLQSRTEPTDDEDIDVNGDRPDDSTNTTLDFGVLPQIDLAINKTLQSSSVITPGGTAVFRLTVTNNGPIDATGVTVVDTLPAGLTFAGLDNNGTLTATQNGQDVTIVIGDLEAVDIAGNGGVIEFDLIADIADGQTTDVINNVVVSTLDQFDIDDTNNADAEPVNLISTDLRIDKTAVTDPIAAGGTLVYQITVTNDGPDDATGVFVTDALPGNVTFVSGNVQLPGEDGTADNSNLVVQDANDDSLITINIGDVANGASAIVTLTTTVDVDSVDTVTNPATVGVNPDTDPNPANDTSSTTDPIVRNVDLAIDKTFTPTGTNGSVAGGTGQYTLTVVNNGPGVARGVTVVDVLPDGVNFVSQDAGSDATGLTQDGGDDNDGDDLDRLNFTLPDIAPGAANTQTITFNVSIDDGVSGTLSNTATVATTDIDTVDTNNTDTADFTPGLSFDLTIDKTVNLATATPGLNTETLTYTIVVTNDAASASTAPNVQVTDVIPEGLTAVSVDAPGGVASFDTASRLVTVDYASLTPGQSATFTINAAVQSSATGNADGDDADTDADDIVNTATVASTTNAADETNANNNTDTAQTDLTPSFDLQVVKTLDPAEPDANFDPGEDVAFNVVVTNVGPSDSVDFVLSDPVPAGLTFVSGNIGGTAATLVGGVPTFAGLNLAAGGSTTAVLNFTVNTDADGTIVNTASVPDNIPGENNVQPNSDSATITAVPVVVPTADVTVTKTDGVTTSNVGDQLTYTITATNNGPSPADAVTITDNLPDELTFVSATGPGGAAITPNTDGDVVFNGGTLASGASFTVTILATIDAGTTGTITNPVTVTTTTVETDTTNNAASDTTTVNVPDPNTSSIAGTVFVDLNDNGIQDAGEAGIAGVTLNLTGTDVDGNAVDQTEMTDADGNYLFDNLAAGTYSVAEVQPAAFRDGQDSIGTGATGAVAADDVFSQIGLGQDVDAVDFDFGELPQPLSKRRFLASFNG